MGELFVVPTPIGNMSDMSERAWEALAQCDFIAAEDTRVCMKLLSFRNIKKPLVSYYEHNKRERGEYIVQRILNGENCALVSDAGTPAISDPGEELCRQCAKSGIRVTPIPGCCAAVTALCASGFPTQRFTFEGFLSTNKKSRNEHLESLINETRTMIFYEAPHKLKSTLKDLFNTFGERPICIAREITKIHEQFIRTTLSQAIIYFDETPPKGEFVLIIKGKSEDMCGNKEEQQENKLKQAAEMVQKLISGGVSHTSAVKQTAAQIDVSKSQLYKLTLPNK